MSGIVLFTSAIILPQNPIDGQVLDTVSNRPNSCVIPLSSFGGYIAVNPSTNKIYVANAYSNTTSVIDGDACKELTKVKVGTYPLALAVNPITNKIYVLM